VLVEGEVVMVRAEEESEVRLRVDSATSKRVPTPAATLPRRD
jgi:hypothetical protein